MLVGPTRSVGAFFFRFFLFFFLLSLFLFIFQLELGGLAVLSNLKRNGKSGSLKFSRVSVPMSEPYIALYRVSGRRD